jgi:hypothetical protein
MEKFWRHTNWSCQVRFKDFIINSKIHKIYFDSGRSSVFAAMFGHDTLEAKTNRVMITDVDYETMQELLRFIYCEKVSDLKKLALNLLPAADKVFNCH